MKNHIRSGAQRAQIQHLTAAMVIAGWERDRASAKARNLVMVHTELHYEQATRAERLDAFETSIGVEHDGGPGGRRLAGQLLDIMGGV
jgi:hypothetical protein